MKPKIYILLLLLICPIDGYAIDIEIPEGYRLPQPSDYPEYYRTFYKNRLPRKIEADFDGNGKTDVALLLIKNDNSGWSLFVFIWDENHRFNRIILDDIKQKVTYLAMGISELRPGNYKTACGKGYWDCRPGEPERLELKSSGINYFRFESANSVFYWDKPSQKFSRIWLSD